MTKIILYSACISSLCKKVKSNSHGEEFIDLRYSLIAALCAHESFCPNAIFEGYSISSQTVSELSAIDAPTRTLWVLLAIVYILLVAAFGWGVRESANGNPLLRNVAVLIMIYVTVNLCWPPMHLRGNEPTLTDTLHIVWAMITLLLMMLIMGFGAAALGRSFRLYTIATFVVFITFGILIGTEAPGIPKNLPTPRIGIWERINIGAYMLWVSVFAIALLRKQKASDNRT